MRRRLLIFVSVNESCNNITVLTETGAKHRHISCLNVPISSYMILQNILDTLHQLPKAEITRLRALLI